jgi:hypothetical protein
MQFCIVLRLSLNENFPSAPRDADAVFDCDSFAQLGH